jgi:DNA-binding transcriptional LysR family regulator
MPNILNRLDLNLLVALDVFLDERSVTRSAVRLSLSQPAASATLGRLRLSLGDQLLVRSRGEMFLTARAEALRRPIKDALRAMENALEAKGPFVPSEFDGRFRLAMTDLANFTFGSGIIFNVHRQAPRAMIDFLPLDRSHLYEWFRNDSIDAAIVVYGAAERMLQIEPLLKDEYVFVAAKTHPLAGRRAVPISRLTSYPLIEVSISAQHLRPFFERIEEQGHKWTPTVSVPHFLGVPSILRNESFVGITGRIAAEYFSSLGAATILKVAEKLPAISYKLLWHRRRAYDPSHAWLRETIHSSVHKRAGNGCD